MDGDTTRMSPISIKLGFWSALLFTILGVGYGIGMGVFFMKYSIPAWTNIESYADFMKSMPQLFYSLCQITAFLSAPVFIILLCSIHEYAHSDKKILTRIAICFGIIFVGLSSITYFIQFTVVPQNISEGSINGLEQFVQLNVKSFIAAIVVLGWGMFMGLTSIFIAPVFSGGRLEKSIKWLFIISGIFCIINMIGYVLQTVTLSLLATGIYDITLTSACILLCILFRGQRSK